MILDQTDEHPGARLLLMLVCFIIVVTGLKAAASILIPFVLALFLAVASMPVMFALRRRRVWGPLAIALTVLLDALVLGGVVLLVTNSLGSLSEKVPQYAVLAQALGREWFYVLEARGFPAFTLLRLEPRRTETAAEDPFVPEERTLDSGLLPVAGVLLPRQSADLGNPFDMPGPLRPAVGTLHPLPASGLIGVYTSSRRGAPLPVV